MGSTQQKKGGEGRTAGERGSKTLKQSGLGGGAGERSKGCQIYRKTLGGVVQEGGTNATKKLNQKASGTGYLK